ncbi:MAG TPA: HAMP domain-containing sensor histidine kinase [Ignavibacteria bacterium]|nr:HAMP domain-containing sensor histidine kinase [Ignavibacteria bacterium]
MRLITKISLWNILIAVLIFLIGGYATYVIYKDGIIKTRDRDLNHQLGETIRRLETGVPPPQQPPLDSQDRRGRPDERMRSITPIPPNENVVIGETFSDTLVFHQPTNKLQPHRKLTSIRNINGQNFKIELTILAYEDNDVIKTVVMSMSILFVALIIVIITSNYFISKKSFKPFYKTLEKAKEFDIKNQHEIKFGSSGIKEFDELNEQLERLTAYAQTEYKTLKEFSENASHEIQTPLAIIKSKLDLLIQSESLTESQRELVMQSFKAVEKLSKLGNALTLLAKIDNNEFRNTENINLKNFINEHISNFKEILELRQIYLAEDLSEKNVIANKTLIDILITNLLQNAIRHNTQNGTINIVLTDKFLEISNTGKNEALNENKIFKRFYKKSADKDSSGLGLSIINKICEYYKYTITYSFKDSVHSFKIEF